MYVSKVPKAVFRLVQPAVTAVAARLFVLSAYRYGSAKYQPAIDSFYETGIVTALYEHMLMSPVLAHLEIRHEMPYPGAGAPGPGAPRRVDLWVRPPYGGYPHLIEAGDFRVSKVHNDLDRAKGLNNNGSNWFLAFFRGEDTGAQDAVRRVQTSLARSDGLDATKVKFDKRLCTNFDIYSPDGEHQLFGAALLRRTQVP